MVCLGIEPGAAEWKTQMNPLSNCSTPIKAHSDLLHKMYEPGLFFMYAKNTASWKILYLTAFYAANYAGLNEHLTNFLEWFYLFG